MGWTDVGPVEPFVVVAAGRCPFSTDGLDARYEQLRHAAVHARAAQSSSGWPC